MIRGEMLRSVSSEYFHWWWSGLKGRRGTSGFLICMMFNINLILYIYIYIYVYIYIYKYIYLFVYFVYNSMHHNQSILYPTPYPPPVPPSFRTAPARTSSFAESSRSDARCLLRSLFFYHVLSLFSPFFYHALFLFCFLFHRRC